MEEFTIDLATYRALTLGEDSMQYICMTHILKQYLDVHGADYVFWVHLDEAYNETLVWNEERMDFDECNLEPMVLYTVQDLYGRVYN